MMHANASTVLLFSYGTLQLREVQLATFGRELAGCADRLPGYVMSQIAIADPDVVAASGVAHHPIVRRTGDPSDQVAGVVFALTEAELAEADAYETDDYARLLIRLVSGTEAFVYVAAEG